MKRWAKKLLRMKVLKISIATVLLVLAGLAMHDWIRELTTLLAMIKTGGPLEVTTGASRHVVDARLFGLVLVLIPVVLLASSGVLWVSAFKERKDAEPGAAD